MRKVPARKACICRGTIQPVYWEKRVRGGGGKSWQTEWLMKPRPHDLNGRASARGEGKGNWKRVGVGALGSVEKLGCAARGF